jgi:hypothetical protein
MVDLVQQVLYELIGMCTVCTAVAIEGTPHAGTIFPIGQV